ncbi:macrolide family glycosyltransferase [Phytohabitans suffuscus]|uniref:UDP glycosyltransferase n=1 Tax=Phytohabitans suffuscus TaxID=624315 RepID=A0A6F8YR20_9ACTN|nr:macrolide family glycosyltransferase [Phytohabitans suffuscus]BCB88506.1 UDP glycosyltransferase [Phytohabitans suffuscus]
MTSYHLLFVAPGGSGHINPALGIVDQLVRTGHRVTVVTGAGFADAVTAVGARFAEYKSAFDDFHVPDAMAEDNAEQLLNDVYIADNEVMLRAAEEVAAADPPDAVVYDIFHFIAGKLLVAKLGCPGVRLEGLGTNEHYSVWEELRRSLGQRYPEEFDKTREEITALLTEFGIDKPIRRFWDEVDPFTVVTVPRAFQPEGDTFDGRFVFAGPCFSTHRLQPQWTPPAGDPPVLVVSLGSTWNEHPEFFRACAYAFEGTPWHVVLAIGEFLDPETIGELPANVEAHSWISFLDVLRHASAFITQGTIGAVMESVYNGCPLLVFSHFAAEAEPTASRALALGLGHPLRIEQITAEALREAVSDLTADEEVRRRVDRMRQEILDSGGAARAAGAIVERLSPS